MMLDGERHVVLLYLLNIALSSRPVVFSISIRQRDSRLLCDVINPSHSNNSQQYNESERQAVLR